MTPADSGPVPLTDGQIEKIAEKAAAKAVEKMTGHLYQEVGKSVVSKGLYVIGVAVVALVALLYSKGLLKL